MSMGSTARELRRTSRRAPSSRTTKSVRAEPLDRVAALVDGAHEERPLAAVVCASSVGYAGPARVRRSTGAGETSRSTAAIRMTSLQSVQAACG
jgi:hypothetical protein